MALTSVGGIAALAWTRGHDDAADLDPTALQPPPTSETPAALGSSDADSELEPPPGAPASPESASPDDIETIEPAAAHEYVGQVVDEHGTAVPGVRLASWSVVASGAGQHAKRELYGGYEGWSSAGGFFRWTNERVDSSWIVIDDDPRWRSDPVEAHAGGPSIRIVAHPREIVGVRVVDPAGGAICGATVRVAMTSSIARSPPFDLDQLHATDAASAVAAIDRVPFRSTTDSNGLARVALPDRRTTFELTVAAPIDRDDVLDRRIDRWDAPADSTVTLPLGESIRGRVVNLRGEPVRTGMVIYPSPTGVHGRVFIESDGSFRLPKAAPGDFELRVDAPELRSAPNSGRTTVHTGTRDALLRLDTGRELVVRVARSAWDRGNVQGFLMREDEALLCGKRRPDGTIVFEGLRDGEEFELSVLGASAKGAGPEEFTIGRRLHVTAQDSPIDLELTAAKSIELMVVANVPLERVEATVVERRVFDSGNARSARGRPTQSGGMVWDLRIDALPDGMWTVRASGTDRGGNGFSGQARAAAGTAARVVLAPDAASEK